jgi:hypothetical protein
VTSTPIPGAPPQGPADREQAEEGDQPVPQEVQRVRLQRLRPAQEPADYLHGAVADVQQDDDPESAPVRRRDVALLSTNPKPVQPVAKRADCVLECREHRARLLHLQRHHL